MVFTPRNQLAVIELQKEVDSLSYEELFQVLVEYPSHAVYVIVNGALYGIVTIGRISRAYQNRLERVGINTKFTAIGPGEAMRAREIFCEERNNLERAAKIHVLPVVDSDGQLLGNYTRYDDVLLLEHTLPMLKLLNTEGFAEKGFRLGLVGPFRNNPKRQKLHEGLKNTLNEKRISVVDIDFYQYLREFQTFDCVVFEDRLECGVVGMLLGYLCGRGRKYKWPVVMSYKEFIDILLKQTQELLSLIQKQGVYVLTLDYEGNNSDYLQKFDVVYFVDEKYVDEMLSRQPVKPIEILKNIEYDYILITIYNQDIAIQVKSILVGMGIAQNKILTVWDRPIILTMEQLSSTDYMQAYLHYGFERGRGIVVDANEYYPELHESIVLYEENRQIISFYFRNLLPQMEESECKIVFLYLLYEHGYFDSTCLQMLMRCMRYTEWRDDTYYAMIMESSDMIHRQPSLIYDDFFTDRIALQEKICEYYGLYQLGNVMRSGKKRIAIIVSNIRSLNTEENEVRDGIAYFVRNYTQEFWKKGYEICIFDFWAGVTSDIHKKFLQRWSWTQPEQCIKMKEEFEILGLSFVVHWDPDIGVRLQKNMRSVIEFQPSFILDMADEFFPEAYALLQWFPVIQLPMRSNDYSSAATIRIFGNKEAVRKDNSIYKAVPNKSVREVLLGGLDCWENNIPPFDREKYGFSQEDFLLVTVSCILDLYIDIDMVEAVCYVLKRHANMKWILVGDICKPENVLLKRIATEKQIILWGYEKNLEGLYGMCDVCLNLPRRGGGISLRLAMKMGLPVATTDFPSGILNYMDPNQVIHGGCKELMTYVERLYEDQELYRKASEVCRRQIAGFSPATDAEKILAVCQEAEQLWEQTNEKRRNLDDSV